ncbi:VOC family protein [Actinoplanes utahensis]|uniref:Extradiol dioxygenase n=1 Tax=Actinoplanes utahensis TaxID=1869 RepID=A0A0A6XB95_ACTUT|nr:VOC family protein [Actinoplanes utahensis]KHD77342.1 extradiol dioxygenase [Actinoplanes utahensis]GIF32919.1 extradiol dioxygenase [Actinoplanes utahensis]
MPTVQAIVSTPHIDRQIAFYQELLGAVETNRHPAEGPVFFVSLRLGDSEFGIVGNADTDVSRPSRTLLSIEVDDVDALLPRVEAAGGRLLGPPNDMPWGQRVAHVHDPDGNMVNLTCPVPAREPAAQQ